MKKLKDNILFKPLALFYGVLLILFIFSYFLLKYFILDEGNNLTPVLLLIAFLFISSAGIIYFLLDGIMKKIFQDTNSLKEYVYQISENKNYELPLQIKNYLEFLEIALLFKNIVKRLHQKDKKTSKK